MKGPSSEAIKKLKLQLEQKKRDEFDRKVQGKLSTLKHRAAQGDKKAKQQLKIIEKEDEERCKPSEQKRSHGVSSEPPSSQSSLKSISDSKIKCSAGGPKPLETDFEELMKLAVNNKNEVKHLVVEEKPKTIKRLNKLQKHQPNVHVANRESSFPGLPNPVQFSAVTRQISQPKSKQIPSSSHIQTTSKQREEPQPSVSNLVRHPDIARPTTTKQPRSKFPIRRAHRDDDGCEEKEVDDYESDGFVVHEEDDEVRSELDKTLRTMFRYDKRRCDIRERELDREYRAIGRVSTFEDLEREERRASKLAAAEDAKASREEEERKRLKKMRQKGMRGVLK